MHALNVCAKMCLISLHLQVLYVIFSHHTHPPTCAVEVEKTFIRKAIEVMQVLGKYDRNFFTELMVQFLDGDKEIRCASSSPPI